ncbi:monocarboxylate transporter 13-like [Platysternon megacephalum]|uniref:Monocarboxylate transporter 13-like n=1 Tax=Platysternon megacephalum TaxID=55544 RepID=A0A4D9DJP7_9SAUR|nr:monocarboxylate transporter 13-like [Platysternon megacephalum]
MMTTGAGHQASMLTSCLTHSSAMGLPGAGDAGCQARVSWFNSADPEQAFSMAGLFLSTMPWGQATPVLGVALARHLERVFHQGFSLRQILADGCRDPGLGWSVVKATQQQQRVNICSGRWLHVQPEPVV